MMQSLLRITINGPKIWTPADSTETEVEIASGTLNLTADAFSWEADSDYESDCDDDNLNIYYNFASSCREKDIKFQFSDKM